LDINSPIVSILWEPPYCYSWCNYYVVAYLNSLSDAIITAFDPTYTLTPIEMDLFEKMEFTDENSKLVPALLNNGFKHVFKILFLNL